jgi:hypothetical protein
MYTTMSNRDSDLCGRIVFTTTLVVLLIGGLGVFVYFFAQTFQAYSSNSETRSTLTASLSLFLPYLSTANFNLLALDATGKVVEGPPASSYVSYATNGSVAADAIAGHHVSTYSLTLPAVDTTSGSFLALDSNKNVIAVAQLAAPASASLLSTNAQGQLSAYDPNLNVQFGAITATQNVSVGGSFSAGGGVTTPALSVTGPAVLQSTLAVTGSCSLGDRLTVTGQSFLQAGANVAGNLVVSGGLVQATGGLQLGIKNAQFLSTDSNGNLVPSVISNFVNGSVQISQSYTISSVVGDFNVSGIIRGDTIRLTHSLGTAADYAAVATDGSLVPSAFPASPTNRGIVTWDNSLRLVANGFRNQLISSAADYITYDATGLIQPGVASSTGTANAIVKYSATGGIIGKSLRNSLIVSASDFNYYDATGTIQAGTASSTGTANSIAKFSSQSGLSVPGVLSAGGNALPSTQCTTGQVLTATSTGALNCGVKIGAVTMPTTTGTAGQVLVSDGAGNGNWGSVTVNQYITTSSTFTVPANVKIAFVSIWGGGGGGAGGNAGASTNPGGGGGGGGGAYIANINPPLTAGMVCVFQIGVGGTGGNANQAGTGGTATTVQCDTDATYTANGGGGGLLASVSGTGAGGGGGSVSASSLYRSRPGGSAGYGGNVASAPGSGTSGGNSLNAGGQAAVSAGSINYSGGVWDVATGGGGGGSFLSAGGNGGYFIDATVATTGPGISVTFGGGGGGGGAAGGDEGNSNNFMSFAGGNGSPGGARIQYSV